MKKNCLLLILGLLSFNALAEPKPWSESSDPIQSLLLDRTVTPFGKQFFKSFSEAWNSNQFNSGNDALHLLVKESLLPQSRTLIQLEINHRVVYRSILSHRKRQQIDQDAQDAFQKIAQFIAQQALQQSNEDIAISGY
ncbi:MAG: CsgE family curli-type amyloid fiber assembly protein [Pseudomonadota bacterium]